MEEMFTTVTPTIAVGDRYRIVFLFIHQENLSCNFRTYHISLQITLTFCTTSPNCWKLECALYVRKHGKSSFCHYWAKVKSACKPYRIEAGSGSSPYMLALSCLLKGKIFSFFSIVPFKNKLSILLWGTLYVRNMVIMCNLIKKIDTCLA